MFYSLAERVSMFSAKVNAFYNKIKVSSEELLYKVSSEELLLSRSIRSELSRLRCHGHSLLLSSYLHRISRKENSDCSACGHPLQDLNHLLLDCPASEPLRKSVFGSSLSILDLWSRPWGVARLLGLRGVPPRPRKGSGSTTTTTTKANAFDSILLVCIFLQYQ